MAEKRKISGKSFTTTARKRRSINFEMKVYIIKSYERGNSLTCIANTFGLNRSTVRTILNDKDRILKHVKELAPMQATIISKQRSTVLENTENNLIAWLEDMKNSEIPVTIYEIQQRALTIYEQLKQELGERARDVPNFRASRGWYSRFKNRANLRNIMITGEAGNGDDTAVQEYVYTFAKIVQEGNYSMNQVFNIDETGLFWKRMPEVANSVLEEKSRPGLKASKDRLSLLLGGNAAGDFKLTPLLVYHSENPLALQNITKASLPVIWMSDQKAWVTLEIFKEWFYKHFVSEVKLYCAKNEIPFKILLVLDIAPAHPPHLDDFHPDIKVIYLPANTNSTLQPMDQGVMRLLKAFYTRRMFTQAVTVTATEHVHCKTLQEFLTDFNIYGALLNIVDAWHEIPDTAINSAWIKLYAPFVKDCVSTDETLQNVIENILDMSRQLKINLGEDDVQMLLDSHAENLTSEELIELSREKQRIASVQTFNMELAEKRFDTKLLAQAFKKFDEGLELLEQQDPNTSRYASVSRHIANALECYKQIYLDRKIGSKRKSSKFYMKKEQDPVPSTSSIALTSSGVNERDLTASNSYENDADDQSLECDIDDEKDSLCALDHLQLITNPPTP
ncbi:hypothetical protein CBL_05009 [Carabus blaptoides fortunei]